MSLLNIVKEQGIVSIINILKEEMEHFEKMEKMENLIHENTTYCIKELDGRGIVFDRKDITKEEYLELKNKTQEDLFTMMDCSVIIYGIDIQKNIDWGSVFTEMGDDIPDDIYNKHMRCQTNAYIY